jgi:hypothetical protein
MTNIITTSSFIHDIRFLQRLNGNFTDLTFTLKHFILGIFSYFLRSFLFVRFSPFCTKFTLFIKEAMETSNPEQGEKRPLLSPLVPGSGLLYHSNHSVNIEEFVDQILLFFGSLPLNLGTGSVLLQNENSLSSINTATKDMPQPDSDDSKKRLTMWGLAFLTFFAGTQTQHTQTHTHTY